MIFYPIKKFSDYFLRKIDENLEKEAVKLFNEKELSIYNKMQYYDKLHGLDVYKQFKKYTKHGNHLKFAILHDCGKEYSSFFLRVLHKFGFKTKLRYHAENGYNLLKDINIEVAELIRVHHNKNVDDIVKIFQKIDDRS